MDKSESEKQKANKIKTGYQNRSRISGRLEPTRNWQKVGAGARIDLTQLELEQGFRKIKSYKKHGFLGLFLHLDTLNYLFIRAHSNILPEPF